MKKIKLDLEYCYGIKRLKHDLDFSRQRVIAIYAPNGSMKSSLAQTFMDVQKGVASKDRYFLDRCSKRKITDENNNDLNREAVFVVKPYDEEFGHSEETSTLLVDSVLRKEFEQLHKDVDAAKAGFLRTLKEVSSSEQNCLVYSDQITN